MTLNFTYRERDEKVSFIPKACSTEVSKGSVQQNRNHACLYLTLQISLTESPCYTAVGFQ